MPVRMPFRQLVMAIGCGFALYYVVVYFLTFDSTDYDFFDDFHKDAALTMTDLSLPKKDKKFVPDTVNSISDDGLCQWDALGPPQFVRTAGCNKGECNIMTCRKILSNDSVAMKTAVEFMNKRRRTLLSEEELYKHASNCSEFRIRGGYRDRPLRASDADFPIAFNLLIHWHIEQFERLLRILYRPQNFYCIHVDAKTSWTFQAAIEAVAKCFDNVFVATRRQVVVYEGFSRLQADIDCMKDHLFRSSKWRYLLNVAGQSYPLRTPEEMVDILQIYNGANDIEGLAQSRRLRHRYEKVYIESIDKNKVLHTNTSHTRPPHDIEIVRGSAYGIFSYDFVRFIINDQRAIDLLEWSKPTFSPDEHYWATLHHIAINPHLKTPGGFKGAPEAKPFLALYVKWYPKANCSGVWRRGICILGVGDLPDLMNRPEFFVNKFAIDYQPIAYECLEAWIEQRVLCPVPLDLDYYRSLPFVIR